MTDQLPNLLGVFSAAMLLAGCGLYEDAPLFNHVVPNDEVQLINGDACGPCDLGRYEDGACDLGPLQGAISPDAACDKVVFADSEAEAGGDGSIMAPFSGLQEAIDAGNQRDARVVVIAGAGPYAGPVKVGDGLSMVGGFTRAWVPDAGLKPNILAVSDAGVEQHWAMLAHGLGRPTILRNLRIETQGGATTHYGLRVVDAQHLLVERVRIKAADARHGAAGADGAAGAPGGNGGNAGLSDTRAQGDAGINAACPDANGGAGGRGGMKTSSGAQDAEPGEGSSAGVIGGAVDRKGNDGSEGDDGRVGEDGDEGSVLNDLWVLGRAGGDGAPGKPGEGGSGGGGGSVQGSDGKGGGGGGGAAGGCGGEGGRGGANGGASFGIFNVGSQVVVRESEILSGAGGNGALGGAGGQGGPGGKFGFGADGLDAGSAGGRGGNGGDGGRGGDGGSGQGGISYAIYCSGDVEVVIEDTEMRAGNGGHMGGDSTQLAPSGTSKGCGL